MLPIIGVPETIRRGLASYRPLFCRDEGFERLPCKFDFHGSWCSLAA
jgi:hypothetical protein